MQLDLSEKEANLIETIRKLESGFGGLGLEFVDVAIQNGQPTRMEWELISTKESKLL